MTVCGKFFVNRFSEVESVNNCRRTKVEYLVNNLRKLIVAYFACAECFNKNRNRLCNTDCICKLNLALIGKTCGNNILCNPTSGISGTSVNLCRVLARKCTAAVAGISAVCINNNFSAGKTRVACRAADNESACRVNIKYSVIIHQFGRNGRFDNIVDNILAKLLKRNICAVL